MNCDRCGKEIATAQKVFEIFNFCKDCHEKVMFELESKKYET